MSDSGAPIFRLDLDGYTFDEERIGTRPAALTDEIIEYVAGLLSQCKRKTEIRALLTALLYGDNPDKKSVPATLFEITIRYARLWLKYNYEERTIEDFKASGIALLQNIIADDNTKTPTRMKALKDLNWILGIGQQFVHPSSAVGNTKELIRATITEMDDDCESASS